MDQALAVERPGPQEVESGHLLGALAELAQELGYRSSTDRSSPEDRVAQWPLAATFSDEEQQLVLELRAGLAELVSHAEVDAAQAAALCQALDGAEFVIRDSILTAQRARLPRLLPSFVFLVLLPVLGKAQALRSSARVVELLTSGAQPH